MKSFLNRLTNSRVGRAWKQASSRDASLLSAGVAFYAFLSIFPTLIAATLAYGLFFDAEQIQKHADRMTQALPADAASLISGQLTKLADASSNSLSIGILIALATALWSASGGVGHLLKATAIMRDDPDWSDVHLKLSALTVTLVGLVAVGVLIALLAAVPALLALIDNAPWRVVANIARWFGFFAILCVVNEAIFRVRPSGATVKDTGLSLGAVAASAIWTVASLGLSVYAQTFGSYAKTYGAFAGVALLMLWLWLGAFSILFGVCFERRPRHAVRTHV